MSNQNKIGALWINEKNGKKYMSGDVTIDGQQVRIVVFKNTYKEEGTKQPDYNILISERRDDGGF